MLLIICQLFYVFQSHVALSKYLPSCLTRIIIFRKQQCVESMPEEIQMLVKRFLFSFYIHIETLVKVAVP